jgi:hypothetical protein
MMCGGHSNVHPATEEIQSLVNEVIGQIQQSAGEDIASVHAIEYSSQVVAGTNYNIKCKLVLRDGQEKVKKVKVHKPLPHKNEGPVVSAVEEE